MRYPAAALNGISMFSVSKFDLVIVESASISS
jgi:hypothetical protein